VEEVPAIYASSAIGTPASILKVIPKCRSD
jgi:hypothetical protein